MGLYAPTERVSRKLIVGVAYLKKSDVTTGYPAKNDLPVDTVKKNPSKRIFSTKSGEKKWGYPSTINVGRKGCLIQTRSIAYKKLALITALFCPCMEPLGRVSRGKTGEGETGKREHRYRLRTPRRWDPQYATGNHDQPHHL